MTISARPSFSFKRFDLLRGISLVAFSGVFMTMLLSGCASPRDPGDLAKPKSHLLGEDRGATGGDDTLGDGVNAYLWRGALDTLSFMPFSSADAVGGIILTDWYTPPTSPDERFKIAAYVMSRRLRSDSIRVAVFRQERQGGVWVDSAVSSNTVSDITTRILNRARELRAKKQRRRLTRPTLFVDMSAHAAFLSLSHQKRMLTCHDDL